MYIIYVHTKQLIIPLADISYKIKDASVPHKPNYDSVLKIKKKVFCFWKYNIF